MQQAALRGRVHDATVTSSYFGKSAAEGTRGSILDRRFLQLSADARAYLLPNSLANTLLEADGAFTDYVTLSII